jgi:hypothetical protein
MPRRFSLVAPVLVAVLTLVAPRPAFAQSTAALINEELDRPARLELAGPLDKVVQQIVDTTGLPLRLREDVADVLPYGRATPIRAKIENLSLRQALGAITGKLGLTFSVEGEQVLIYPMPALLRLDRAAGVNELNTLDVLRGTNLDLGNDAASRRTSYRELLVLIDKRLQAVDEERRKKNEPAPQIYIENRIGSAVRDDREVILPAGAVSIYTALEEIVRQTPATWYPWDNAVVLKRKSEVVNDQLNRPAGDARMNGLQVEDVLDELSRRSGAAFRFEPAALRRVPAAARVVQRLDLSGKSVRAALEQVAARTGLAYVVDDDGVYLYYQQGPGDGVQRGERVVLILELDGGVRVPLTESQVPEDVKQYVQSRTDQAFAKLREQMKRDGIAIQPPAPPTTKPREEPAN